MAFRWRASQAPKIAPQPSCKPHSGPVQTLMGELVGGVYEEWDEAEYRRWCLWELVELGEADSYGAAAQAFRRLTSGSRVGRRDTSPLDDPLAGPEDRIPGTRMRDL